MNKKKLKYRVTYLEMNKKYQAGKLSANNILSLCFKFLGQSKLGFLFISK